MNLGLASQFVGVATNYYDAKSIITQKQSGAVQRCIKTFGVQHLKLGLDTNGETFTALLRTN